jgi:carboxylesterase type B
MLVAVARPTGSPCVAAAASFAANGTAIVVAVSYRQNAFGYLALRELSGDDPRGVSGNYGVLDIQMALQWVQKAIPAFGGNPDSVTVYVCCATTAPLFGCYPPTIAWDIANVVGKPHHLHPPGALCSCRYGQSAGGANVLALLASPGSRGLFHAAISLSGSPNITMDLPAAEAQNARTWLANTTCAGAQDVLSCVHSLSPEEVLSAVPSSWNPPYELPRDPTGLHLPGLLIVDGVTVPQPLLHALAAGTVDVPVIMTTMRDVRVLPLQ